MEPGGALRRHPLRHDHSAQRAHPVLPGAGAFGLCLGLVSQGRTGAGLGGSAGCQYGDPDWTSEWIQFEWTIGSHPQEIFENGIDYPHFACVHGFEFPSGAEFLFEKHEHIWRHSTNRGTEICEDGREDVRQEGRITGLGSSRLRITGELDVVIFFVTTPVTAERLHIRLSVLANLKHDVETEIREKLPSYAASQARTLTEDFDIWEHKKYRPDPKLCHRDGPIAQYRQWAAQFYG